MKIYHHNDLDGRCAAAVVLHKEGHKETNIECIEVDYKDPIKVEDIRPHESVVIVDFSFRPDVMQRVLDRTQDVIWIDHHKTAFEYDYGVTLPGLRSLEYSGCELAWKYFSKDPIPYFIQLIGDRDKWAWKLKPDSAWFNEGIGIHPHGPCDAIWGELFDVSSRTATTHAVIVAGKTCLAYRDTINSDYMKHYSFDTTFCGYCCRAMNLYRFGSEAFGAAMEDYDICLSFVFDGRRWTVGLYSQTVDVSEIAKQYGGGGHRGAAGFVCDYLPFGAAAEVKA